MQRHHIRRLTYVAAAAVFVLAVLATRKERHDGDEVATTPLKRTATPGSRSAELAETTRTSESESAETLRVSAPGEGAVQQTGSSARATIEPAQNDGKVRLDVLVIDHETGSAIPGVPIEIHSTDHWMDATTDASGLARFRVAPGPCTAVFYPSDDLVYLDLVEQIDAGDPAARSDAAEERVEITLSLHRSATVRGRFLVASGRTPPQRSFRWLRSFSGDRWFALGLEKEPSTDSAGAFEFRGLEPASYLIAPLRDAIGTFAIQRMDVTFGDVVQADVWITESRPVSFEVDVVQTESHKAWPFPLNAHVRHKPVGLEAQIEWSIDGHRLALEHPPLEQSLDVTPGTYTVSLFARTGQRTGEAWICSLWGQNATVEVDELFRTERQTIEVPDAGPVARVDGSLSSEFPSTPKTVRIAYAKPDGDLQTIDIPIDADKLSFTLWVDLNMISDQQVSFSVPGHENGIELASIVVVEGRQQITIGPRGR